MTGDFESRAARVAQRRGLSAADARKLVADDDAKRLDYLQENYKRSSNDALLYDVVFRLDRVDPAAAVSFIRQWAIEEARRQHQPFDKQT